MQKVTLIEEGIDGHNLFSATVGPIKITVIDADQLARQLVGLVRTSEKTHHVVTANAQFYNLAEQRRDFRDCVANAEYVCADGISIVMACRWLAGQDVARIAGVDLVEQLCAQTVSNDFSVYFLGGREGSARMAADYLSTKYSGFQLAGLDCPPHGFEENPEILQQVLENIRRLKPSMVFVALGAPRQELFIQKYIRPLKIPVAIGVGGSFEIIAGRVRRAPSWVRQSGFEWAYRWFQEPMRLTSRYLVGNSLFCFYLVRRLIQKGYLFSKPPYKAGYNSRLGPGRVTSGHHDFPREKSETVSSDPPWRAIDYSREVQVDENGSGD